LVTVPATTYILLFRGVGGSTQLPTAPLRAALSAAKFDRVTTYINSGNAIVTSPLPREKVVATVADICRKQFGFSKAIFAITDREWSKLIVNNPFPKPAVATPKFVHAAVLEKKPTAAAIAAVREFAVPGEGFEVVGQVAYLHTPHGFGTSKLAVKFDAKIGVVNTARNWNTVLKLRDLANRE
jgi:uncharacterized protein (DUF1697 family)